MIIIGGVCLLLAFVQVVLQARAFPVSRELVIILGQRRTVNAGDVGRVEEGLFKHPLAVIFR